MDELKNKLIAEYIERNNIKIGENQDIEDVLNIEDKYDGYNLKELVIDGEEITIEYDEYDNIKQQVRKGANYEEVLNYNFDGKLDSNTYTEKTKNNFDEIMTKETVIKYHRNGSISSKSEKRMDDTNTYNYYSSEGFSPDGKALYRIKEETKYMPVHENGKEYSTKISKDFFGKDGKAKSQEYFLKEYPEYFDEINALENMENIDYTINEKTDINGNLERQDISYGDYKEVKEYKDGKLACKSLDKNTKKEALHECQIYNEKGELETKSYAKYNKEEKTGNAYIRDGHGDYKMAIHVDDKQNANVVYYDLNSELNPNKQINSSEFYGQCTGDMLRERNKLIDLSVESGFKIEDVPSTKLEKIKKVASNLGILEKFRALKELNSQRKVLKNKMPKQKDVRDNSSKYKEAKTEVKSKEIEEKGR